MLLCISNKLNFLKVIAHRNIQYALFKKRKVPVIFRKSQNIHQFLILLSFRRYSETVPSTNLHKLKILFSYHLKRYKTIFYMRILYSVSYITLDT